MPPKRELTPGHAQFVQALETNYGFDHEDAEKVSDMMQAELSKRINDRQRIAFIKIREDGRQEVSALKLTIIDKKGE